MADQEMDDFFVTDFDYLGYVSNNMLSNSKGYNYL